MIYNIDYRHDVSLCITVWKVIRKKAMRQKMWNSKIEWKVNLIDVVVYLKLSFLRNASQ